MSDVHDERSGSVVAFSGHLPDAPDRAVPRFPLANEPMVAHAIAEVLTDWKVGPGDRCLCGGARGGDLLFAEACLAAGAEVALLLALPIEQFIARSVAAPGTAWEERFRAVVDRSAVRFLSFDGADNDTRAHPFGLFNQWLIDEAIALAAPAPPRILVLWDGAPSEPARSGTGDFVDRAREAGIPVRIIDPLDPFVQG